MQTRFHVNLSSLTVFALPILSAGIARPMPQTPVLPPSEQSVGESHGSRTPASMRSPLAAYAPSIAVVNLSTNSVQAGQRVQGVVKLDATATELTTVTLTSSIPLVAKPALSSVTIKPGSSVAFFEVNTRNVALRPVSLVITASANGTSKSADLTVLPK